MHLAWKNGSIVIGIFAQKSKPQEVYVYKDHF